MHRPPHALTRLLLVVAALVLTASPALAHKYRKHIPAFARKYNISCSVCHAPVPRLTAAGEAFAGNGFEFEPGEEPRDTINTGDATLRLQRTLPLAMRMDAYFAMHSRKERGEAGIDLQTPWVVKLLSGGQIANKVSYYTYFLMTERGSVEGLEDAYVQFTDVGGSGIALVLGQFQVSDPLFKREVRLTYDDYQPYRLRVGKAVADLTYDRGVTATWSPWEGGDFAASVINGRGLNEADDTRKYDADSDKNAVARFSQAFGPLRLGVYGYFGSERQNDRDNRLSIVGPDATLSLGDKAEINAQFLSRRDDDPFYGTCTAAAPCPGGRTTAFSTTVKSGFVEAIFSPQGPAGKLFFSALYNWADADLPVISLRLGEQGSAPGYLSRFRTMSVAAHYLHARNLRMLTEVQWDSERERARLVTGFMTAW